MHGLALFGAVRRQFRLSRCQEYKGVGDCGAVGHTLCGNIYVLVASKVLSNSEADTIGQTEFECDHLKASFGGKITRLPWQPSGSNGLKPAHTKSLIVFATTKFVAFPVDRQRCRSIRIPEKAQKQSRDALTAV
jgi:hypothetical protein